MTLQDFKRMLQRNGYTDGYVPAGSHSESVLFKVIPELTCETNAHGAQIAVYIYGPVVGTPKRHYNAEFEIVGDTGRGTAKVHVYGFDIRDEHDNELPTLEMVQSIERRLIAAYRALYETE